MISFKLKEEEIFVKKIFSVILVLAVAGSAILSAQAKVNLNVRLHSLLLTGGLNDASKASNAGFDHNGGNDNFTVAISGEKAGVQATLKPDMNGLALRNQGELYAWMKFGDFRILGGIIDGYRYANRVTTDASSWERFEMIKYGVLTPFGSIAGANPNAGISNIVETDTLTNEAITSNSTGYYIDYTGVENLKVSLGTAAPAGKGNAPYNILDNIGATVGYKVSDIGNFNVTAKRRATRTGGDRGDLNNDIFLIGAFANITMVKDLNLVVGYSGLYDIMDYDVDLPYENTAHAVELRAYYKLGNFGFTTHNNFTFGDEYLALSNMFNITYKLNEYFMPSLWLYNVNSSGDRYGDNSASVGNWFRVRPGITITAMRNATIDLGVQFDIVTPDSLSDADDTSLIRVMVPMTFRVRM
jgi:hypothetical protein